MFHKMYVSNEKLQIPLHWLQFSSVGLLTSIERHIQLYTTLPSYNTRALNTLDSETLFGSFQDIDPKGQGVLHPDDIPCALNKSCELLSTKLDDSRYLIVLLVILIDTTFEWDYTKNILIDEFNFIAILIWLFNNENHTVAPWVTDVNPSVFV